MEHINPIVSINLESQLPKEVAKPGSDGLAFHEVMESLENVQENKEVSSGASTIASTNSEKFVDYFLKSVQGKQQLDDCYKKHQ